MRISDWSSDVCSSDLVDDSIPENEFVRIGDNGLVIQRLDRKQDPPELALLEARLKEDMPPVNILDLLTESEQWLDLHRLFGPLSGFETKIDDPRKRFITTLFCYGCNLGPTHTARSVPGQIGRTSGRERRWEYGEKSGVGG